MRYILEKNIALRSWLRAPRAYYCREESRAHALSREEFDLLLQCDGATDTEASETLNALIEKKLIRPAVDGRDKLSDWQKLRTYKNRYMPQMNLEITERCNCKCRHCFNASDEANTPCEMAYADVLHLLDEAAACGIHSFTITGGEPLLYSRLTDVFRYIYAHDMHVAELNTNLMLLTREFLTQLKALGAHPLFKFSFDGIGFHDWMRGMPGAEALVIEKIRLCHENGFQTYAQINVNRKNVHVMEETLELMERLGVSCCRIIRTSESPRWLRQAGNATLEITEYYNSMTELAARYLSGNHRMQVIIWQYLELFPAKGSYSYQPVRNSGGNGFSEKDLICTCARGMIAVCASGDIYPCMQASGAMRSMGISYGNVKTDGLQSLLTQSTYMDTVCTTVGKRVQHNSTCRACPYLSRCLGGCPTLAIANGGTYGDFMGPDSWKCVFFKEAYWKKCDLALKAHHNLTPL